MNTEDLEVRAQHTAKTVLDVVSKCRDVGKVTLFHLQQMCLDTTRREFPALLPSAQGHIADRAQILFLRMWLEGKSRKVSEKR